MTRTFTAWVPRAAVDTMDEAFEHAKSSEFERHDYWDNYWPSPTGTICDKDDYLTVDLRTAPASEREARDIAEAILPHGYDGPAEPAWVIDVPGELGGWLFFGCATAPKDEWIRG